MPALRDRPRPAYSPPPPHSADQGTRRRFLRRMRARRWRVLRRVVLAVLVLAMLAGGVWLVFFSAATSVSGGVVRGVEVLSEREVLRAAQVPVGVPVATADLDAVQARVEQLAPVREAEVSRAWPDQIAIEVTEREAVVAVEREGTWRGVDEQGVAFRDFPAQPKGMPVVQMSATTSVEALAEAAAVVGALPPEIDRRVERLEVGSIDRIALLLTGGARVNWGSADQAEDKARVLAVLLEQKGPPAASYDVTAPGRPTVRR